MHLREIVKKEIQQSAGYDWKMAHTNQRDHVVGILKRWTDYSDAEIEQAVDDELKSQKKN